jgi:protein-S-isoprenylcysteine O-methyltransferase Ste14
MRGALACRRLGYDKDHRAVRTYRHSLAGLRLADARFWLIKGQPAPVDDANGFTVRGTISLEHSRKLNKFILEKGIKSTGALASLGLLLFTLAGRVNILGFWIYIAVAILYQTISLLIIVPKYPEYVALDDARKARHTNVKEWDRAVLWALMGFTFLMYGLAALDLGHLHVGELSVWFAIPGVVLYIISSILNQWAMVHNPHFERAVRIQHEREHRVVKTGPYSYVRHPGYLGSMLFYLAFPLISGSALAFVGSTLGIIGTVARTSLEDRTLREELAGYAEYAQEVRYRLMPYVW